MNCTFCNNNLENMRSSCRESNDEHLMREKMMICVSKLFYSNHYYFKSPIPRWWWRWSERRWAFPNLLSKLCFINCLRILLLQFTFSAFSISQLVFFTYQTTTARVSFTNSLSLEVDKAVLFSSRVGVGDKH